MAAYGYITYLLATFGYFFFGYMFIKEVRKTNKLLNDIDKKLDKSDKV